MVVVVELSGNIFVEIILGLVIGISYYICFIRKDKVILLLDFSKGRGISFPKITCIWTVGHVHNATH